jgi:hypothetical protein
VIDETKVRRLLRGGKSIQPTVEVFQSKAKWDTQELITTPYTISCHAIHGVDKIQIFIFLTA